MRQRHVDDPWAQQLLLRAEARLTDARAFTERRAAARDPGRSRAPRGWLGHVLPRVGWRRLRPLLGPANPA
jgi:alkylation response protein AidB-like acyl-CoA dehydrogenase